MQQSHWFVAIHHGIMKAKKLNKLKIRHISSQAHNAHVSAQGANYYINSSTKFPSLAAANRRAAHNSINNVVAMCKYIIAYFV